ncbi:hypothetical protein DEA06_12175 [Microbacterium sp. Gd 4-13]|uniref:DUF5684 domain-containing protein n=1 Tax=Microbacterium sp. Gd 4-13 TaxID=2173179 RepID=UPI000D5762C8|nr:DUF5684 domain-containing protein [Microbacterium sp. Gd 4-13]PVW03628.1 hypothetical protein DEA06_12175 [Microbacterium sp. Gd 4-13]
MNDSSIGVVAGLITFAVIVVLYLWASLSLAAVFRKAGEDAWQAWVPILNTAVLLRLGGFSPWLVFIVFVPLFGQIAFVVILVISYYRVNVAFGFGGGMTVVAALFPLIWASIVGFGSARWIGEEQSGPRRTGDLGDPADAALAPRARAFTAFEPMFADPVDTTRVEIPRADTEPQDAAPLSTGFWAPTPEPQQPAASTPPPAPVVVPKAEPPAESAVVPPPASFLTSRRSTRPAAEPDDSAVDPEDRETPPSASSAASSPSAPALDPEQPRRGPEPAAPIESVPTVPPRETPEVAPAPVAEVPEPPAPAPVREPWAPGPLRAPASPPRDPEQFPELSEAISAVPGAPDAGAPRPALSSVSALYAQGDSSDDEDDDLEAMDRTIVARRRRVPWKLIPPGGAPIDISSEVVILGRRPAPDATRPGAQLIAISDETRTVSKTHARLELRGETWFVTDLDSTNGVLFATLMGTEIEAQPGEELEAGERFFLGDAEVRLTRSEA